MQLILYLIVATVLLLAGRVRAETSECGSSSDIVRNELTVTLPREGIKNAGMSPIQ
jgi:hypothetical protein